MKKSDALVFVVDDDPSVRNGLARLLKAANVNVESFSSAGEFLKRAPHPGPCCLVLDIKMPGFTGLDLQEQLSKGKIAIPIIFLTGHGDVPTAVKAMKMGAYDFLTKPVGDHELLEAIGNAHKIDATAKRKRAADQTVRERIKSLTPREFEVLQFVVAGMLNKQIAFDLGISEKTVKVHRSRVMQKMEVDSLAELVRITERIQ